MGMFAPATREKTFLKAALAGPAGAGKSWTMLDVLHGLQAAGLGKRIAVIETEAGKIKKYAGYVVDGRKWAFEVGVLTSFGPQEYIAALESAVREGFDLIGIDSMSHEWQGSGGALELVDRLGEQKRNQFAGWKDVTPMHNRFIETILRVPAHVVATVRLKMDYVIAETEKNGRKTTEPRKIGLAPVQRNGLEYEFEIYCTLDESHILRVEKTICPAIDGKTCVRPGASFWAPVFEWLGTGEDIHVERYQTFTVPPEELAEVVGRLTSARKSIDDEKDWMLRNFGVRELAHLSREQFKRWLARVDMILGPAVQAQPPLPTAPVESAAVFAAATAPANGVPVAAPAATNGTAQPLKKSFAAIPQSDVIALWEELGGIQGWDRAANEEAFRAVVLEPYGVTAARDLQPHQWIDLRDKLIDVLRKVHAERGTPEATPF